MPAEPQLTASGINPQAIARREEQPLAVVPSPGEMMQQMIKSGISAENVAAFTELVKLSEHMEDRKAEKEFAVAFNALQAEMPKIQATRPVPGKDGSIRFKFAAFEDLMAQVSPLLQKHGFTVCFNNRYENDRVIETCILQHIGGHKRPTEFACKVGSGPPNASGSQADGAAATYAKRFALTGALNIVVSGLDNDARLEGSPITAEQAEELEHRVKMINSDPSKWLKWAGAKTFATIPSAIYEKFDEALRKKETGK